MLEALVLGMVAQSSLLLSGLLDHWVHVPTKVVRPSGTSSAPLPSI
jgi:hypothetical protein